MRIASDRSAPMATWIGGAIGVGFAPAEYAVMLRRRTGTSISGRGSGPNAEIENGGLAISFQDLARRTADAWTLQLAR
jgi:hypothetical protein